MLKNVRRYHYDTFFHSVAQSLDPDGLTTLHPVGQMDPASTNNPWIGKDIFSGGYIPSLAQIMRAVEKSDLLVTNMEIMRLHYARTLKAWRAALKTQE